MKIAKADNDIQTGGSEISSNKFGIGNLGLVMKIFRELMYKDPISAICREISCNARDAHRENNCGNERIEIHLPNKFDKNWKVKDWGPGIPPDRMVNIVLQYGNSTKRNDNDQTGGWGLGAKTPFSKTNQFSFVTITTDYDGHNRMRVWFAHIDESDQGTARCVKEDIVDEPTGTEVIVPVKDCDFDSFAKKTIQATTYWDIRPNIIGNNVPEYPFPISSERSFLVQGDNWTIFNKLESSRYDYNYQSYQKNAKVIIDGIAYSIDNDSLGIERGYNSKILDNHLHLYFNVGEIVPAPNREHLHYDDNTKKAILDRLDNIRKTIFDKINKEVRSKKTYTEALFCFEEFKASMSFAIPEGNVSWNGHDLKNIIAVPRNIKCKISNFTSYRKLLKTILRKGDDVISIDINKNVGVYLNDLSNKRVSRARVIKLLETFNRVQVITFADDSIEEGIEKWKNAPTPDSWPPTQRWQSFDLNLINPGLLSDTKLPPKIHVKRDKKTSFDSFIFNKIYRGNRSCDNYWEPSTSVKKTTDIKTYVVLHGHNKGKPTSDGKIYTIENLLLAQRILGDETIVGIRESSLKFVNKNWRTLKDVLAEKSLDIKQNENVDAIKLDIAVHERYCNSKNLRFMNWLKPIYKKGDVLSGSLFLKYFIETNRINDVVGDKTDIINFLNLIDEDIKSIELDDDNDLSKIIKEVKAKYPMLKAVDRFHIESNIKEISDYINIIDNIYKKDIDISPVVPKLSVVGE